MLKVLGVILDILAILLMVMMFIVSIAGSIGGIGYKAILLCITALLVAALVYLIKGIRNKN